jgi:hypothetical protein
MASVITIAGEQLFAAKAQANEPLDIDTFIFANVPSQDPAAPINREEGIPTAYKVHQQAVQQFGKINENVVVYSTVLDSMTGPFEFNWVGLYSSVNQTLVAINHIPTVSKTATTPGAAGNTLNRNFGIEYSGIADLTGITVAPETWQLDFTARLSGMDRLTQQLAADMNGKDWFIENGFKVVPRATANTFSVMPGVGYVSGLRIELKQEHILTLQTYPQFVYVDAWFSGTSNSIWTPQVAFTVTNGEMDDYIDPTGVQHYVNKLALVSEADVIEDLRNTEGLLEQINKSIKQATVSQLSAGQFKKEGTQVIVTDRGAAIFEIISGGIANGIDSLDAGGGNTALLRTSEGVIHAKYIGMRAIAGVDNSAALKRMGLMEWSEFIIDDDYEYTSNVVWVKPYKNIKLSGGGTLKGINAYFTIQGTIDDYGQLVTSSAKGGKKVGLSSTENIKVGDVVIIHNQNNYSFSKHRPEYHDGEFNVVSKVDGNELSFEQSLVGNYTSLTKIKLFKLNPVTLAFQDINILAEGNSVFSSRIKFSRGLRIDNSKVKAINSNSCVSALVIDKSYDFEINGGHFSNDTPSNNQSGTQYGISISNSQLGEVDRVTAHAARHATATGGDAEDGAVPCRYIKIKKSKLSNDGTIYSADFHGNTADSGYYDCVIDNDIGLAGQDVEVVGGVIIAKRNNPPVELHEIVGGKINIKDVKVKIGEGFTFNTMVAFSSSDISKNVDRDFEINIQDLSCEINAGVENIVTMLYNQETPVKSSLEIGKVKISGDDSALLCIAALSTTVESANPDHVFIRDLNYSLKNSQSYVQLSGSFSGTQMTLPSRRSQIETLSIPSGDWKSTTGGVNGILVWDYPKYPITPNVYVHLHGWPKGAEPQLIGAIEQISKSNSQAYISTASSTIKVPVKRDVVISMTATFENIIL